MQSRFDYLKTSVCELEVAVQELGSSFDKPTMVFRGEGRVFRHDEKTDLLMSYLKSIRLVSSLNAVLLLLEQGYAQEVGVLFRCIQDFIEDILFLCIPLGENGLSNDQKRFVEEFFQEEFDAPDNPFASTQKRDRVPRSNIQAGIARIKGQPTNPSDAKELYRTIQQAFSGYVHGAYPHIMNMYGGLPPRYHTHGMPGTPRTSEFEEQMTNYIYRSIAAAEIVAKRVGNTSSIDRLSRLRKSFETATEWVNTLKYK